jgi:hypothetical protein
MFSQSLADALYPAEVPESRLPETDPSPDALAEVPAEKAQAGGAKQRVSISPAARKYASEKGVDLATVTGSGKNGAITKGDIDKAMGGNQAGEQGAQAAAPAPSAAAADDMSGMPLPGMLGMTQADVDALEDPIPGAMGLTRGQVADYLDQIRGDMSLGDNNDAATPPPTQPPAMDMSRLAGAAPQMPMPTPQPSAMDMSRLAAAAQQSPQSPDSLTADQMLAALTGYDPNAPMQRTDVTKIDMRDLFGDPNINAQGGFGSDPYGPELPEGFGINPQGGVGSLAYGPDLPPASNINADGGVGSDPYGPTPPKQGDKAPWSPITSRADRFLEAMGLGGMAGGMHVLTKPADFALRQSPWLAPLAGAAAYKYATREGGGPTDQDIQEIDQRRNEAQRMFEREFGADPGQPAPQYKKPQPPPGRGQVM